jgi:enoyl-[acyl-carrier protein] reductase III
VSGFPRIDFSGKTALVTGGTRGIGAAVAGALGAAGARLVLGYRSDAASAEGTRARLAARGADVTVVAANLAHPEEIRTLVSHAPRIDVLVHAAALGSFKPLLETKANQFDLTMAVNARSFLLLAREATEGDGRMPNGSSIVALSSLGGARVVPEYGAIGASKAALESLVRSLAVELGPKGIRVNAVTAGLVDTASVRLHPRYAEMEAHAAASSPLGRIGTPEDAANAVLLLSSPLAGWITGQCLVADGGAGLSL